VKDRIRILSREAAARGFGLLERLRLQRTRFDGRPQQLAYEIYDTGDGAAILLCDPSRGRVLLVRQFRLPPFLKDGRESLIEVCAGRLEGSDPESRIKREAEEETGYRVRRVRRLFEGYVSPGAFCEKLTFFAGEYAAGDRSGPGGGADADEDIELLEPTLDEALAMIAAGEIIDAKTILLLQYAKLEGLLQFPEAG